MSEMVERVAKAMELVMIQRQGMFGTSRDASSALARAAIEAMREPTEEMIDSANATAAYWHHDTSEVESEWREEMLQEYQAMIDEALK